MKCKRTLLAMIAGWLVAPGAVVCADDVSQTQGTGKTVLGIDGSRFTLNGKPVFLLGFSYYGGLGASEESIQRDLDDFQKRGFNWFRLWATWSAYGQDVSALDSKGAVRSR